MARGFSSSVTGAFTCAALLTSVALASPSGGSVSIHAGPGPKWPVIGNLPAGQEVFISDCVKGSGQHDWCKISASGTEGYVREGTLAPVGEQIFVAPIIASSATMLRKGPTSRSAIVAVIPASSEVHVAHCTRGWLQGWCKAHVDGKTGYLKSDTLHRQGM